jgi:nucleotide-binding universal stress UspA family protein
MLKFRRILVAVDLSDTSDRAIRFAGEMAQAAKTPVELFYVVGAMPREDRFLALTQPVAKVQRMILQEAREELSKRGRRLIGKKAPFTVRVEFGDVFSTLLQRLASGRPRVDLAVLGTHGRSGLAHAILGSVAEKLVRAAPCPVVVVKPEGFVPPQ